MASPLASQIRIGSRGIQFACSLIALATIAAGFKSYSSYGYSASLGGSATNFAMLMTYTSMLFSLWYLVAVEIYQYVPRPQLQNERYFDGVFAVLLFIAGIVLATSDYVSDCDAYGEMLKCGNLKAGVAFTFLAMASFLATLGLTFLGSNSASGEVVVTNNVPEAVPYHIEATPTGALSPIGNEKSPSANV